MLFGLSTVAAIALRLVTVTTCDKLLSVFWSSGKVAGTDLKLPSQHRTFLQGINECLPQARTVPQLFISCGESFPGDPRERILIQTDYFLEDLKR